MTWLKHSTFFGALMLLSCSHKTTENVTQEVNRTHWGEIVNLQDNDELVVDCVFVVPVRSLWGDSMTVPPLPPAPSFHYVSLSGSSPRPVPRPVPVYVRKTIKKAQTGVTTRGMDASTEKAVTETKTKNKGGGTHWWVYVLIFLFVDIIGLFVYFVWRIDRN